MPYEKLKIKSCCPGGQHQSSTKNKQGEMNKFGRTFLIGECVKCDRKKSMFVNDKIMSAEGHFFSKKNWERFC